MDLISNKGSLYYKLLEVRFQALRQATFFDTIDPQREVLGYIRVSDFPAVTMRVVKATDKMLDWWKTNGKSEVPPHPYIIEVADELFVRDNTWYTSSNHYSDCIFASSLDELMVLAEEAYREYNNRDNRY